MPCVRALLTFTIAFVLFVRTPTHLLQWSKTCTCTTLSPSLPPAVLARDPQSVVFYDSKGQFVGVRRPGSGKAIAVEGLQLVVEGVVGATGLELKNDPGVPAVYAGGQRGWVPYLVAAGCVPEGAGRLH